MTNSDNPDIPPGTTPDDTTPAPAPTTPASNLRTLRNGAVYDLSKGRIVTGPPGGGPNGISQMNTNEYHELSRQARLDAVYRGIAAGTRRANAHDAVEAIVTRQTELAMAIDRGRASTEASRFVFQAGELIQDRRLGETGGLTVTAHVTEGALASLLARLDGDVAEIIDGQVRDASDGE